jgi:hypothetical protein
MQHTITPDFLLTLRYGDDASILDLTDADLDAAVDAHLPRDAWRLGRADGYRDRITGDAQRSETTENVIRRIDRCYRRPYQPFAEDESAVMDAYYDAYRSAYQAAPYWLHEAES